MAKHLSCKSKQCIMLFSLAILDKCCVPASKSPPPETGRLSSVCCNKISTDGMACTADVLFFFPLDISGVWKVQDHGASRLTVSGGQACWLIDGRLFTGMAGGAGGWWRSLCRGQSLQWCPTLCDPMDHSPPGSSVHGIHSPGKDTGVGCHALLQGMFPPQGSNPYLLHLLHWQAGSFQLAPPRKPMELSGFSFIKS